MPDAAILCGGLGTRLRDALPGVPKALAPIGGRAFLDMLLGSLDPAVVGRIVLCIGVGAERVRAHYAGDPHIAYSEESEPLGTGGALALARVHLGTDPVLAMNGDSLVPGLDWANFARTAPALVLVPADGRTDAGVHAVDSEGRVGAGAGFHSAGIYHLPAAWLAEIPAGRPVSLERELLPVWIARGVHAYIHDGELLDIGTPERWAAAQRRLG